MSEIQGVVFHSIFLNYNLRISLSCIHQVNWSWAAYFTIIHQVHEVPRDWDIKNLLLQCLRLGNHKVNACGKLMPWISMSFKSMIVDTMKVVNEYQGDGFLSVDMLTGVKRCKGNQKQHCKHADMCDQKF